MRKPTLTLTLALLAVTGRLPAQQQAQMSAQTQAELEATISAARAKGLPERPIEDRIAEGRAKAATEAQIVASARRMSARLEATQQAMVRAGRERPAEAEIERGARAMERGTTEAQLEAMVRRAPSERSLVVAFDVLARLEASGMPVERALAQVTSRLESRASDHSLIQLAVSHQSSGSASIHAPASVSVGGSGNAGAGGQAAAGSNGGAVSGGLVSTGSAGVSVGGLIRKPPTP
jgi:hypothetical protein